MMIKRKLLKVGSLAKPVPQKESKPLLFVIVRLIPQKSAELAPLFRQPVPANFHNSSPEARKLLFLNKAPEQLWRNDKRMPKGMTVSGEWR